MKMKNSHTRNVTNQTFSNRIERAEFDDSWKTTLSQTGYVIYTATTNNAEVELLLSDGTRRLAIFPKGGKVLVGGGGTSHFSKPHVTITI